MKFNRGKIKLYYQNASTIFYYLKIERIAVVKEIQ